MPQRDKKSRLIDEILKKQSSGGTIKPPPSSDSRIVGGTEVSPACPDCKYPFMAQIQLDGDHRCGGALIHPEWVLTAGHCLEDRTYQDTILNNPERLTVRMGVHDQTKSSLDEPWREEITVDDIVMHPDWIYQNNSSGMIINLHNDIALIHL